MTLTNDAETKILALLVNNVAWPAIGDAAGLQPSAASGDLFISLHTADPGGTGTQLTSEAAYGGYARVPVARSAGGWEITADTGTNASDVAFAESTGGQQTITHFGIGTALTGAGSLILSAALSGGPVQISTGSLPKFLAGTLDITAQ